MTNEQPQGVCPLTEDLKSTGFNPNGVKGALSGILAPIEHQPAKPWVGYDPSEAPRNSFNIRLNDHDLAVLRYLAALSQDISMQKIVRRILVPELHRRAGVKP